MSARSQLNTHSTRPVPVRTRRRTHARRMVVQLSVLGHILVPIFRLNRWWLVLLYASFMLAVASIEAVQRPAYTFQVGRAGAARGAVACQGRLALGGGGQGVRASRRRRNGSA